METPSKPSGPRRLAGPRTVAWLAALFAVSRVVLFGLLDRRPRFGGSETSDLCNLMQHHWGVHGYLGEDLVTRVVEGGFKPPLYYAGLPLLLGFKESLDYPSVLAFNVLALVLLLAAAWRLGLLLGGERAAAAAVVVTLALPALAGRSTVVGVELFHTAIFGWLLVALVHASRGRATWRSAAGFGTIFGLGLLAKWNLAFAVAGPMLVLAARWWRTDRRRLWWLVVSGLVATIFFLVWWLPLGDLDKFITAAGDEVTNPLETQAHPLLFLGSWALQTGLGWAAAPLVLLWVFQFTVPRDSQEERPRAHTALMLSGVLTLLLIHTAIPHKEIRYLLPAYLPIGVLLGISAARWFAAGGVQGRLAAAAVGWLLLSSFVGPVLGARLDGPPETLIETRLRFYPDPVGLGLDTLALHESLRTDRQAVVAYSLEGLRWIELRDMLSWELYSRNDKPVLSHMKVFRLEPTAPPPLQLNEATHFISNRRLAPGQESFLESLQFTRTMSLSLPVPEGEHLELWVRGPS